VRDERDNLHGISLDASGNRVSQSALDQAVQTINKFCGQVEAELANFLTQSSDSTINVVVQLKGKVASVQNERSNEQDDAKLNTIRSLNAAIQQPIVNQLKTKNRQVIYQSAYGPVVVAAPPRKSKILQLVMM